MLLTRWLQKFALFLHRDKRKSQQHKRQLKTVLKKLRHREQSLRQRLKTNPISSMQQRALQTDADITNLQRRKGLKLLKNIMQDLRS